MNIAKNKPAVAVAGLAGIAVLAWLAFGFFGIQTAFIDNEVDQAGPVFSSQAESDAFDAAMAEADANQTEANQSVDDTAMAGDIITLFSGNFQGLSSYTVEGEALVLNDGTDQRFLRLENFSTNNGPDLKVVLRADNGDLVNLGPLQGNIGDQNYELTPDIDLNVFNTVEIYCERFGVLFGLAPISAVAT